MGYRTQGKTADAAFDGALREFARRDRRFGRVTGTAAAPAGYSRAE